MSIISIWIAIPKRVVFQTCRYAMAAAAVVAVDVLILLFGKLENAKVKINWEREKTH